MLTDRQIDRQTGLRNGVSMQSYSKKKKKNKQQKTTKNKQTNQRWVKQCLTV